MKITHKKHDEFLEEVERIYPHLSAYERIEMAAHLHATHPGFHSHHFVPSKWRWHIRVIIALLVLLALGILATHAHAQNVTVPNQDTHDASGNLNINCVVGCGGGSGGTSSSFSAAFPLTGTAVGVKNGANMVNLNADNSGNLDVNCLVGCAGGSTTPADAFANPTTAGLQFDFLAGFNGTTWDRLRSSIANGLQVDVTRVQGTVGVTQSTSPWVVSANGGSFAVTGTFFQSTQPVSCASAATCPVNASQVGSPWGMIGTTTDGSTTETNLLVVGGESNDATAQYQPIPLGAAGRSVIVEGFAGGTAVPVSLTSTTITGTVAVTQSTSPWVASCTAANCAFNLAQEGGTAITNIPTAVGTLGTGNVMSVNVDLTSEHGTAITNVPTAIGTLGTGNVTSNNVDFTSEHGTAITNVPTAIGTLGTGNVISVNEDLTSEHGTAITNVPTAIGTKGAGNVISVNSDTTSIAGTATVTAAAGVQKVGIVGNANAALDAANNAAVPANVIAVGAETATQTSTQPAAATAGNMRRLVASTDGALYVRPSGPVIWSCGLNAIAATLTQCQAAPGAGLRLYITDIVAQSNTATAGLFTVRFGTGANCVTGTGNLFFASASALIAAPANTAPVDLIRLTTPIPVTANNAICVLGVATNTTNIEINGYSAP